MSEASVVKALRGEARLAALGPLAGARLVVGLCAAAVVALAVALYLATVGFLADLSIAGRVAAGASDSAQRVIEATSAYASLRAKLVAVLLVLLVSIAIGMAAAALRRLAAESKSEASVAVPGSGAPWSAVAHGPAATPPGHELEARLTAAMIERRAFEAVLDALDDAVIATCPAGRIERVNDAAERLFGLPADALVGRPIDDFVLGGAWTPKEAHASDARVEVAVLCQGQAPKPASIRWCTPHAQDKPVGHVFVATDLSALRDARARAQWLASFDAVTELPNDTAARDTLRRLLTVQGSDEPIAVLGLQVLHLDALRVQAGAAQADQLLRTLGWGLRDAFQRCDFIAHLGRGQFVVLAKGASSAASTEGSAERHQALDLARHHQLSLAFGLALAPRDGADAHGLIELACVAAKEVDEPTRPPTSLPALIRRVGIELDFDRARKESQLYLCYQPIVALRDNVVVGFEALLRWHHDTWGELAPAEFIGIAERSGQIAKLDVWALREACRQQQVWRTLGRRFSVSVNFSPLTLGAYDVAELVSAALRDHQLDAGAVRIEVTERGQLERPARFAEQLAKLRALGVGVELDDFGTGNSNLQSLRSLPIDAVKIDRMFVQKLPFARDDAAICEAIVKLARERGLAVVAEGIETDEQRKHLRRLGCDFGQGYFWSVPVTADKLRLAVGFWDGPASADVFRSAVRDGHSVT